MTNNTANRINVKPCKMFDSGRKQRDTVKLANQLTATAILEARGLAFDGNNSATRNQGMAPGPLANMAMYT